MSKAEKQLGSVIRSLREESGISQEELAAKAGIHRTYVSQLERGVKSPTVVVLQKIAMALDMPPSSILRLMEGR